MTSLRQWLQNLNLSARYKKKKTNNNNDILKGKKGTDLMLSILSERSNKEMCKSHNNFNPFCFRNL